MKRLKIGCLLTTGQGFTCYEITQWRCEIWKVLFISVLRWLYCIIYVLESGFLSWVLLRLVT